MKFSIVVPIYNTEQYLERCIESLINQTYSDIEIILVDDESPDHSPEICDKYSVLDKRVKVIHKKNGGLSDARNAGVRHSSGEYIIFVDSDDYVELDMCERINQYTDSQCEILIGDAIVEGGRCDLGHITFSNIVTGKEYLLRAYREGKAPMAAWLNIYQRKFLLDNNLEFKYGILHEDEQFTPRSFLKAQSVVYTGIPFYHYVIRENSITTKKDKRKNAVDLYNTLRELESLYENIEEVELRARLMNSLSDKYLNIFFVGKLYQYGSDYIHKDFVKKNALYKKTKIKAYLYNMSPRVYYYANKVKHRLLNANNV